MSAPGAAAGRGMPFGIPGGDMHVEMSVESSLDIPVVSVFAGVLTSNLRNVHIS